MKAYQLFDIQNKKKIVSRDVIFHETIFPFHTVTIGSVLPDFLSGFSLPINSDGVSSGMDISDSSDVTCFGDVLATNVAVHDSILPTSTDIIAMSNGHSAASSANPPSPMDMTSPSPMDLMVIQLHHLLILLVLWI